jgi:16S rRNA (guanine966-N2)-methyltransferase
MSVKILGGEFRGFPLQTPKSELTRPTSVIVRRKLFDWRQNLEDYFFIDLCSGSGAVGFEALSRGADKIWLNEMLKGSFLTIKDNRERVLKSFNVEADRVKVTQLDARKWLEKELPYEFTETENTIIYLDPPYEEHALYDDLLALLVKQKFKGEVWLESDLKKGPAQDKITGAFRSVIKVISQGDHFVVVGFLL